MKIRRFLSSIETMDNTIPSPKSTNDRQTEKESTSNVHSSAGIFLFKLAGQPVTMITALIVANFLGPEEKGMAALSRVLPTFFAGISSVGIPASLKYKVGRKDHLLSEVAATSIFLSGLQGTLAGTGFYFLTVNGWLGPLALDFPSWLKISCALLIPVLMIRHTIYMGQAGNMNFRVQNILDFVASIVFAGLTVFFVIIRNQGFEGVLISFLISTCFSTFSVMAIFLLQHRPKIVLNIEFAKFSYHYGLRAWIGTLAKRGNAQLDQLFLGVLAPSGTLGNYAVSATLGRLLYLVPQSIAPVFMNQVAKSKGNIEPKVISRIHRAMMIIVVGTGVTIAIGVSIVAPIILPKYVDVPLLILLFIPGALFFSSFRVLGSFFIGIGKPEKSSYCQFIALIASVISYPILVPLFGGYGAAAASSAVYFFMYLLVVSMYNKHITPIKSELFSFRKSDVVWLKSKIADVLRRFRILAPSK